MASTLRVVNQDILETGCDVLVLKYAQRFYGADRAIADVLGLNEAEFRLKPGQTKLLSPATRLPSKSVLFLGVEPPGDFGYAEIRAFGKLALTALAPLKIERQLVAVTMHGVGFGLDEREAFTAQVAGMLEYLSAPTSAWMPREIVFVEREAHRSHNLAVLLDQLLKQSGIGEGTTSQAKQFSIPDAGIDSEAKKHVFVAMPYDDIMEDVYELGIKPTVNQANCLCERCDHDIFTGDILDRIKERIAHASVIIADMTGSNPNVYLEVGYAWGKGVPTLLIARRGEELKFDVKTQKCIYYKNTTDLKKQLEKYMQGLVGKK